MTGPSGKADPNDQRRIEELREHIQEMNDELAFYQIRWDSLAREGTVDATRELQFFPEGFSELEAEIVDLQNQLHALEAKNTGDQTAFEMPKPAKKIDRGAENRELIALQKEELNYIEQLDDLLEKEAEGDAEASEKLKAVRFKLDYVRKEIESLRAHG